MERQVAPSRVRGLKHFRIKCQVTASSRTLTGAWIEAPPLSSLLSIATVAPSRVRGLKLVDSRLADPLPQVAPSRVRGLKLGWIVTNMSEIGSHPHGCVD